MLSRKNKTTTLLHNATLAFSALELLVVTAIISLLAAISIFAVGKIRQKAIENSDASLVASIAQACESYSLDHDGLYPGQSSYYFDRMKKNPSQSYSSMTGSQVMVAELTGQVVTNAGLWQEDSAKKGYVSFKTEQLDLPMGPDGIDDTLVIDDDSDQTKTGVRHTLLDSYVINPLPILYFPSRPGREGVGRDGSYVFEDNARNSTLYPSTSAEKKFYRFIKKSDENIIGKTYKAGSFIIIAAGKDREYFTEDDVINFARQ